MPLSDKQRKILAFPYTGYDALICDGSIRSGKTSLMMTAFVDDAMRRYDGQLFGVCGKTVDSAVKNIVKPYMGMKYARDRYKIRWRRSDKLLIISNGERENVFEVFGGKDEASYMLIQGRTLAGVLLDEVALQPRSFVEQALARCSVDDSRFWFSCNPDSPQHWFNTEWIEQAEDKNALHLHFELEDNPGLSEKTLARYKALYTGVFYQRYIQGLWVVAEGLVYSEFGEKNIIDEDKRYSEYYISVDYGTLNPFSAGVYGVTGGKAARIDEWYYDGRRSGRQLTDEDYCDEVEKLCKKYFPIKQIVVDPSAASFITALRKRRLPVRKADNSVMDGIRRTAAFLQGGQLMIHRRCVNAIREFGLYRWNEKSAEDVVIKENDHAMDEIRYFSSTILKNKARNSGADHIPYELL